MLVSFVLSLLLGTAPALPVVEIARQGTVRWTNNADRDHTVTFPTLRTKDDKPLTSGNLKPGDRWSHTFPTAGEYSYRCDYIPRMQGKVVAK